MLQIATEYYTPEEMSFKKSSKKRVKKLRKRGGAGLKVDELLLVADGDADFGSRYLLLLLSQFGGWCALVRESHLWWWSVLFCKADHMVV